MLWSHYYAFYFNKLFSHLVTYPLLKLIILKYDRVVHLKNIFVIMVWVAA